ncbi:MAG: Hpt domain-containing protein, partial [Methylococcales bacterium]|nr:Hpt domain-containing protein [Methylococcales bacterium]
MIDLSLLEDFVMGAGESLEEMETALLTLESTPNDIELLNTIFRAIHTIKGAAQFVGLEKVSVLSHASEDLLDLLREGKRQATSDIVNVLIQAKDRISTLVSDLERTQTENTEVDDLVQMLHVHLAEPKAVQNTTEATPEEDLLSSFLEDETATNNFLNDETDDDKTLESFLEDDTELNSFLLDESNDDTEIDSFLIEIDDEDETLESFLTDDTELDSFLLETKPHEDNASFLLDTDNSTTNDDSADALLFDTDEKDPPLSTTPQSNDAFTLPIEEHDQELFEI